MKFTKIPSDTFQKLQLNAGVLVRDFVPSTGAISESDIIAATSGGVSFSATPSFSDFGEDIDNAPRNTKELKKLDNWEVSMTGSFVTVDADVTATLVGAGDASTSSGVSKITPRNDILESDFDDLWWVGDYSDKNGNTNGGFMAIHMMNSLSTGGFTIQSSDRSKGTFGFTFTGHYSIDEQDTVPFEIYIQAGSAEPTNGDTTPTNGTEVEGA